MLRRNVPRLTHITAPVKIRGAYSEYLDRDVMRVIEESVLKWRKEMEKDSSKQVCPFCLGTGVVNCCITGCENCNYWGKKACFVCGKN